MITLAHQPNRAANLKPGVALNHARGYRSPRHIADDGFSGPLENLAHKRPHTVAGAFFVPASSCYGGCAWETFGSAGFQVSRSANPRMAATLIRLAANRGSSEPKLGATPMHALIPPAVRALAHRRMALSALRANSSLSVRLTRYRHHMDRARALEAQGGAA